MRTPMRRWISYPILCNYYITTRCNARCVFCDIHHKNGKDADPEAVFRNLRDLKKLGVRFVDFTGGEPLLHPHLADILREAKRLRFFTTVTTNGLLYPKYAEKLRGMIDLLHFSLDSPVPDQHDAIRGVVCFHHVMESLTVAEALGEKPDILFTVTEENKQHLSEMARSAQKDRRMLLLNPVFPYCGNKAVNKKTLEEILGMASCPYVYVNRGILKLMKQGGNRTDRPRCRAVTTTVVISPDNCLLLPCFHRASQRIPIDGHLFKVHHSPFVQQVRKREGRFPFCGGCTISCYFDPSFTYGMDGYFFLSQISKVKYVWDKYIRASAKNLLKSRG